MGECPATARMGRTRAGRLCKRDRPPVRPLAARAPAHMCGHQCGMRPLRTVLLLAAAFVAGVCFERSSRGRDAAATAADGSTTTPPPLYAVGRREDRSLLMVLILTATAHAARRTAVRETWLRWAPAPGRVQYRFVLGTRGLEQAAWSELERENRTHGDLLMLPGVDGSFESLTRRLADAMVWARSAASFRYLLKVDDDSFVRLDTLVLELESMPASGIYWGYFDGRAPVKSQGKWGEPNVRAGARSAARKLLPAANTGARAQFHLCDRYLPYALGGGYLLSADLVDFIADNANRLVVPCSAAPAIAPCTRARLLIGAAVRRCSSTRT